MFLHFHPVAYQRFNIVLGSLFVVFIVIVILRREHLVAVFFQTIRCLAFSLFALASFPLFFLFLTRLLLNQSYWSCLLFKIERAVVSDVLETLFHAHVAHFAKVPSEYRSLGVVLDIPLLRIVDQPWIFRAHYFEIGYFSPFALANSLCFSPFFWLPNVVVSRRIEFQTARGREDSIVFAELELVIVQVCPYPKKIVLMAPPERVVEDVFVNCTAKDPIVATSADYKISFVALIKHVFDVLFFIVVFASNISAFLFFNQLEDVPFRIIR